MNNAPEHEIAYEPGLVPPVELMAREGISVLEEWFRWAEEWSMLLRVYGGLRPDSSVLEIGCGLGRVAFALRYWLSAGRYAGFEICEYKVHFLKNRFEKTHPNFSFTHADIRNTEYNPGGIIAGHEYAFPYPVSAFDLVYAASVFTHMLPETAEHYFREAARVLRPGGCCVFSFFLLDHYRAGQPRPKAFMRREFDFNISYPKYPDGFAAANPQNLELMTAYSTDLIGQFSSRAGLALERSVPGVWSGSCPNPITAQDVVILRKST